MPNERRHAVVFVSHDKYDSLLRYGINGLGAWNVVDIWEDRLRMGLNITVSHPNLPLVDPGCEAPRLEILTPVDRGRLMIARPPDAPSE